LPQAGGLHVILLVLDGNRDNLILKSYIYANAEVLMQHNGNHTGDKYLYLHGRLAVIPAIVDWKAEKEKQKC
jgi:hypothetical protein